MGNEGTAALVGLVIGLGAMYFAKPFLDSWIKPVPSTAFRPAAITVKPTNSAGWQPVRTNASHVFVD